MAEQSCELIVCIQRRCYVLLSTYAFKHVPVWLIGKRVYYKNKMDDGLTKSCCFGFYVLYLICIVSCIFYLYILFELQVMMVYVEVAFFLHMVLCTYPPNWWCRFILYKTLSSRNFDWRNFKIYVSNIVCNLFCLYPNFILFFIDKLNLFLTNKCFILMCQWKLKFLYIYDADKKIFYF